jgi:hypothetical protein
VAKGRVFVDTVVIIEAFRTGCWPAICGRYAVETVDTCVAEALSGNPESPGYIPVDAALLRGGLAAIHKVTRLEIATLVLEHPHSQGLDDGERDLLAWLYARGLDSEARILISTADRAAIVAAGQLGWVDLLICLEDLVEASGASRARLQDLARHHRREWLSRLKTEIALGSFS